MGKTYTAKTPSGDFKVTTPENSLLSKQAVTSKGIPVPYTNLQLNPYHNTQLDLFCNNNLSFSMHGSQYVTNQWYTTPSTWLAHQLEEHVGCKVLQFITWWRSRNSSVTKPYGIQTNRLLQEKDELGKILSAVTICMNKTLLHTCATVQPLTALKIILIYV